MRTGNFPKTAETVRIPRPLTGAGVRPAGPAEPAPVTGTCMVCRQPVLISEHHYAEDIPIWVHARTWDAYRGTIHTAEV